MLETEFILQWRIGASTAAFISKAAAKFTSEIEIQCADKKANAKVIMEIMLLPEDSRVGLTPGSRIKLAIDGPDDAAAMAALSELFHNSDPPV